MKVRYEEKYRKGFFAKKLPKVLPHLPTDCKLVAIEIRAAGVGTSKEFGECEYQDVRLYIK